MTKVFWFSRHDMDAAQLAALESKLGTVEVTKVNGTAPNVHVPFEAEVTGPGFHTEGTATVPALKEQFADFDIIAIVAPIGLQQQILGVAGDKPVIITKNAREFDENGKVTFKFVAWEQVHKIEVVTSLFAE